MRYYVGAGLVIALALIQTSALPLFSFFGGRPDLVLVLLLAWMLGRGLAEALPLAMLGGVLLGLLSGGTPGVALLALALVAVLAAARELHLLQADVLAVLVAFVGTLLYQFIFLVAAFLGAHTVTWAGALSAIMLPAALLNAILIIPAYRLVGLTVRPQIRRVLA